jgi:hypothetical protein
MVFTTQGLRLLAKVQAGASLAFTRVAVGDGYLEIGQSEEALTALIDQKMSLSITSIVVVDPQATICAVLSNVGLGTGFYWREIGVFATDPDLGEILYGYDNAGDEMIFVPPASSSSFTAVCNVAVLISNASSVTATINPYITPASIGAPTVMASTGPNEVELTGISLTTVATCTPTVGGNFLICGYVRALNSTTPVTFQVTYTDLGGAETTTPIPNQDVATGGNCPLIIMINAAANQPITVKAQAGAIDEIFVSASIVRV